MGMQGYSEQWQTSHINLAAGLREGLHARHVPWCRSVRPALLPMGEVRRHGWDGVEKS